MLSEIVIVNSPSLAFKLYVPLIDVDLFEDELDEELEDVFLVSILLEIELVDYFVEKELILSLINEPYIEIKPYKNNITTMEEIDNNIFFKDFFSFINNTFS